MEEEVEAVLREEEEGKDLSEVISRVEQMIGYGSEARQLAGNFGLDVLSVAWEDNARSKNSCWGPCISDMTLNVQDRALPLVRNPNFEDITWDVPMGIDYKSTANGISDEAAMRTISDKIASSRKFADNVGSLVVAGFTGRPTEHVDPRAFPLNPLGPRNPSS